MKKKPAKDGWVSDVKIPPGARQPAPKQAEEPAKPTQGIVCRACGCSHFEVVYTRPVHGGKILRCRSCRHCGKRIQTYELPIPEPEDDQKTPWWRHRRGRA